MAYADQTRHTLCGETSRQGRDEPVTSNPMRAGQLLRLWAGRRPAQARTCRRRALGGRGRSGAGADSAGGSAAGGGAARGSGRLLLAGSAAPRNPASQPQLPPAPSRQKDPAGDSDTSDSGGDWPQAARQSSGLRGVDDPEPGLSSETAGGRLGAGAPAAAAAAAARAAAFGDAAGPAAASSVSRSSDAVCAKKHTGREHIGPSLQSCVRYLHAWRRCLLGAACMAHAACLTHAGCLPRQRLLAGARAWLGRAERAQHMPRRRRRGNAHPNNPIFKTRGALAGVQPALEHAVRPRAGIAALAGALHTPRRDSVNSQTACMRPPACAALAWQAAPSGSTARARLPARRQANQIRR